MSLLQRLMGSARSLDPWVLDAAFAAGLTAWAIVEPRTFSYAGRAVVLLAMPAAIAWVRTSPVSVLAVEVVGRSAGDQGSSMATGSCAADRRLLGRVL